MGPRCISDCVWDCGRPPPLGRAPANGLVVWLLDWKINVQSQINLRLETCPHRCSSNPADAHFILRATLMQCHIHILSGIPCCCGIMELYCFYDVVLVLRFYLRHTKTNSYQLDWYGTSHWTRTDSVCGLSNAESVSAQSWSAAKSDIKQCIMN